MLIAQSTWMNKIRGWKKSKGFIDSSLSPDIAEWSYYQSDFKKHAKKMVVGEEFIGLFFSQNPAERFDKQFYLHKYNFWLYALDDFLDDDFKNIQSARSHILDHSFPLRIDTKKAIRATEKILTKLKIPPDLSDKKILISYEMLNDTYIKSYLFEAHDVYFCVFYVHEDFMKFRSQK